jgi:ATP-binding cassette subfamily B protein
MASVLVAVAGNTAVGLISPWLYGHSMDAIIAGHLTQVYWLLAVMFLCTLIQAAGHVGQTYLSAKLEANLLWDVKRDLHDRMLLMTTSRREAFSHGELLSRLEGDAFAVPAIISGNLMLIPSIARGIVVLGLVLRLSPFLTLVQLAYFPILFALSARFGNTLRKAQREFRALGDSYTAFAQETVVSGRETKLIQLERQRSARYRHMSMEMIRASVNIQLKTSYAAFANTLIASAASVGVTVLAATLICQHVLTPGQLLTFGAYAGQLAMVFHSVADLIRSRRQLGVSLERIFSLLDESAEQIADVEASDEALTEGMTVTLSDVCFRYGDGPPVLQGITCALGPGLITGIVGLSGSGKTTLFNLILRLYQPQTGVIRINGRNVEAWDLSALRRAVSVVGQDPFFFRASVWENLIWSRPGASRFDIDKACELAHAAEFISSMPEGYDTVLGDHGRSLSAGQRQRLALARALLRESPILLCDEVTANLDAESEGMIHAALRTLAPRRTIVVVAHRPTTVRFADLVAVLQEGRIVDFGTHDDLVHRSPAYCRLMGTGWSA